MIAFVAKRVRWMAIGYVGRELTKRVSQRSVEQTRSELEARLPRSAVRIADALPGDVLRSASTATVAGRTAVRGAQFSRSLARAPRTARLRMEEIMRDVDDARAAEELELRADLIDVTRGRTAADDARLGGRTTWDDEPVPPVPPPVQRGRPGGKPTGIRAVVQRARRSYRPQLPPWR